MCFCLCYTVTRGHCSRLTPVVSKFAGGGGGVHANLLGKIAELIFAAICRREKLMLPIFTMGIFDGSTCRSF